MEKVDRAAHAPALRRVGRPRVGSEDKRARILAEAAEQFARRGYAGTSLGLIAEAAEISKAGLLHHFGSKEELFSTVLQARDDDDLVGAADWDGNLGAFLNWWVGLMRYNSDDPSAVMLYSIMLSEGIQSQGPAREWMHRHFDRACGYSEEELRRCQQAGTLRPDAPVRELARMLVAASDGIQSQWLCARADAGSPAGKAPDHQGAPLDMAEHMRMVCATLQLAWGAPGSAGVGTIHPSGFDPAITGELSEERLTRESGAH